MSYHYNQLFKNNNLRSSGSGEKITLHKVYIFGQKYISFKRKESNHIDFGIKSLFNSWQTFRLCRGIRQQKKRKYKLPLFDIGRGDRNYSCRMALTHKGLSLFVRHYLRYASVEPTAPVQIIATQSNKKRPAKASLFLLVEVSKIKPKKIYTFSY